MELKNLNYYAKTNEQKGEIKSEIFSKNEEIQSRVERVLRLIEQNPKITQQELMNMLKISRKQAYDAIEILKSKNIIYREGSLKTGLWKISNKPNE